MGIPGDDFVLLQLSRYSGEPNIFTVNCPDKPGLGCDLCRLILEFGLYITRADVSTDGRWCYIIFWVVPLLGSENIDWESLRSRLFSVCPSHLGSFDFNRHSNSLSHSSVFLLKLSCVDQKGMLHDVTKVLTELEFTIQRVKVMTTPDGKVLDLFFITDGMGLLHTKERRDDTRECLMAKLGEYCISFELQLAGSEYESLNGFSSTTTTVEEELFGHRLSYSSKDPCSQELESGPTAMEKATITVDNLLSPAHTLLQIECIDQKGLFYDILKTSKDCNIQIAYGRFSPSVKGYRNLDLFIQQSDGKKIVDPKHQISLCSHLKEEMLHPLRVKIINRGPDVELVVANPVEAEIVRHSTPDREWEVYRFLLNDCSEFPLTSTRTRNQIVERVRNVLMGW